MIGITNIILIISTAYRVKGKSPIAICATSGTKYLIGFTLWFLEILALCGILKRFNISFDSVNEALLLEV